MRQLKNVSQESSKRAQGVTIHWSRIANCFPKRTDSSSGFGLEIELFEQLRRDGDAASRAYLLESSIILHVRS